MGLAMGQFQAEFPDTFRARSFLQPLCHPSPLSPECKEAYLRGLPTEVHERSAPDGEGMVPCQMEGGFWGLGLFRVTIWVTVEF